MFVDGVVEVDGRWFILLGAIDFRFYTIATACETGDISHRHISG